MKQRLNLLNVSLVFASLITTVYTQPTIDSVDLTDTNTIHEDQISQLELATLQVTSTTDYTCNIDSTTPKNGPFDIWKNEDETDYKVYFIVGKYVKKLNATAVSQYDLDIVCRDSAGDSSDTYQLSLQIDSNKPPDTVSSPTGTTISVESPDVRGTDMVVFKMADYIKDPESDQLTYTMYSDPDYGYFQIDPYSGEIKTAVDLRTATVDTIPLSINVTDGKNTIGPVKITLKLTDLNERPYFSNLPANITIQEDAEKGDTVMTLTFDDVDPFVTELEPECYVKPNSDKYKFTYEKSSRKLKLSADTFEDVPLDYETTSFYNISCFINDGYLYNEGDYINLYVVDVNEEPYFDQNTYSCNLLESDAGVSQCDLPFKVSDPDSDTMDIVLLPGNNSERFQLTNNDDKLTFKINYDVDEDAMPTEALLTVGVVDEHGLTGTAKLSVTISDSNDNTPEFPASLRSFVISETQELGDLGTFAAVDLDSGSNSDITYTVKGGSALSYVSMVGDGDWKYSSTYPESMGGKSETIYIEAKDNGDPRLSSTGTVIVTFQEHSTTTTTQSSVSVNNVATTTSTSDNSAIVAILASLMSLLLLGLLGLLAYCLCCKGGCGAGGKTSCFGGDNKVQTEKVRRVYVDDYDRDMRYDYYDRDYNPRDVDYYEKRGIHDRNYDYKGRDDYIREWRGKDDYAVEVREDTPYSASHVKLISPKDLPKVV